MPRWRLHEVGIMPASEPLSRGATERRADTVPEIPALLPLGEREREILRGLAAGKSGKDIADLLCISPVTVRNHIQHILEKLGAHSRLQALRHCLSARRGVCSEVTGGGAPSVLVRSRG
jgi:DNA-binding NarL/FixJ family response regulator